MKYNKEEIEKHFEEGQIKAFMNELNLTYFGALAYLYFFNFVSVSPQDLRTDCGRPMYIEFARGLEKMMNEFVIKEDE